MAVETVFSVWVVGFLLATWPDPPWDIFQISTVVLMVVFPFVFFPFSKTLFLAFDLLVRPPASDDFAAPARGVAAARAGPAHRTRPRTSSSRPISSSAVNGFCR